MASWTITKVSPQTAAIATRASSAARAGDIAPTVGAAASGRRARRHPRRVAAVALKLPEQITALLFDMDGVLTQTAKVHAAAWKQMFDEFLRGRDPSGFRPFTQEDYNAYVDGKPRYDGVRDFVSSRGIQLPEGEDDDAPATETVRGLGNRKK